MSSNQTKGKQLEAFTLNPGHIKWKQYLQKMSGKKSWVSQSMRSRRGGIKVRLKGPDCPGDSEMKRKEKTDALR